MNIKFHKSLIKSVLGNGCLILLLDVLILGIVMYVILTGINNYNNEPGIYYVFSASILAISLAIFAIVKRQVIQAKHFIMPILFQLLILSSLIILNYATDGNDYTAGIIINIFLLFMAMSFANVLIFGYRKMNIILSFIITPIIAIFLVFGFFTLVAMSFR
jgi:hypothetical protein